MVIKIILIPVLCFVHIMKCCHVAFHFLTVITVQITLTQKYVSKNSLRAEPETPDTSALFKGQFVHTQHTFESVAYPGMNLHIGVSLHTKPKERVKFGKQGSPPHVYSRTGLKRNGSFTVISTHLNNLLSDLRSCERVD